MHLAALIDGRPLVVFIHRIAMHVRSKTFGNLPWRVVTSESCWRTNKWSILNCGATVSLESHLSIIISCCVTSSCNPRVSSSGILRCLIKGHGITLRNWKVKITHIFLPIRFNHLTARNINSTGLRFSICLLSRLNSRKLLITWLIFLSVWVKGLGWGRWSGAIRCLSFLCLILSRISFRGFQSCF